MAIIGTFNGANIIALPSKPGFSSVDFSVADAVATVMSPFTGQTQTQQWYGADSLMGTATLPPMDQIDADNWISFLMELRGMANCFQLGDPMKPHPAGNPRGIPVVDMTSVGQNSVGAQSLSTRGWTASTFGLLLPGDYLQIGNRLHRVLDRANADINGKSTFGIFPSLRDLPTDGQAISLNNPAGLFRLATNKRTWSSDYTLLTHLSFQFTEFR